MNTLAWWLLQNTLTLTLLVPLVALACRLFRQRPAVQHLLWTIVLIKFLTPPLFAWQWSIGPAMLPGWLTDVHTGLMAATSVDTCELEAAGQTVATDDATLPAGELSAASAVAQSQLKMAALVAMADALEKDREVGDSLAINAAAGNLASSNRRWPLVLIWLLPGIWIGGAALVAFGHLRRIGRQMRILQGASEAPKPLCDEVAAIAARLGLSAPGVLICQRICSPFVWCLGRLRLVWPAALAAPRDVFHARGVIAHELAHIRRGDHCVAWLELAAGIVWWWNPLYWFTRRRLREAAEMACDAAALAAFPEARGEYAQLLLELSSVDHSPLPAPVLALGAGSVASFERRFAMILSERASSQVSILGMLTATSLAVMALPGWAIGQATPTEEKPTAAAPAADNKSPDAAASTAADPTSLGDTVKRTTSEFKAEPAKPTNADNIEHDDPNLSVQQRIKALEAENRRLVEMLQAMQQDAKAHPRGKYWSESGKAAANQPANKISAYRKALGEASRSADAPRKLEPGEAYKMAVDDLQTVSKRLADLQSQRPAAAQQDIAQAERDLLVAKEQMQRIAAEHKQYEAASLKAANAERAMLEAMQHAQQHAVAQVKAEQARAQDAVARARAAEQQITAGSDDAQREAEVRFAVSKSFVPQPANPLDIAERYLRAEADLKTASSKLARIKQGVPGVTPQETIDELQIELERADKLCKLLSAYIVEARKGAQIATDAAHNELKRVEDLVKKGVISKTEYEAGKFRVDEADSRLRQYDAINSLVPAAK